VLYNVNMLGTQGPRKMTVLVPNPEGSRGGEPPTFCPGDGNAHALVDRCLFGTSALPILGQVTGKHGLPPPLVEGIHYTICGHCGQLEMPELPSSSPTATTALTADNVRLAGTFVPAACAASSSTRG
jgi:hypothetical protein